MNELRNRSDGSEVDRITSFYEGFDEGTRLDTLCHVATDGGAFLLVPQIQDLSADQFERYYAWHLETCDVRSTLGSSVHTLYVGRRR